MLFRSSGNDIYVYYKIADGDDSLTLVADKATNGSAIAYQISGMDMSAPAYANAYGYSINADPPSLTPSNGTQDYLWIVYAGIEDTTVASSAPSSFSSLLTQVSEIGGSSSSSAVREYQTSSAYNPGAFTSTIANWIACTLCISPASATGVLISNAAYYNNY